MTPDDFRKRTKAFALRIIRLTEALPRSGAAAIIRGQLVRCGTSVGANYRAACRARSRRDFVAKMGVVEEECDESLYWMELLIDSGQVTAGKMKNLMGEAEEILTMVVASIRTCRSGTAQATRRRQSAIRNPQSAMRHPQSETGGA
jgi:four helix bundle protein